MLMIMVTIVSTGVVSYASQLDKYSPIIDEFERVCTNYTCKGYQRARVTVWDTETGMSHGSRELNVPPLVVPTTEEIRTWIKNNCREELDNEKKIQAIKNTRAQFYAQNPSGFRLGLKEAKDHVEAVMLEEKTARLQSKTAPCGSSYCTYTYCDCY